MFKLCSFGIVSIHFCSVSKIFSFETPISIIENIQSVKELLFQEF